MWERAEKAAGAAARHAAVCLPTRPLSATLLICCWPRLLIPPTMYACAMHVLCMCSLLLSVLSAVCALVCALLSARAGMICMICHIPEVVWAIPSDDGPCFGLVCVEAIRPKHIAIRAVWWDGGCGRTSLRATAKMRHWALLTGSRRRLRRLPAPPGTQLRLRQPTHEPPRLV